MHVEAVSERLEVQISRSGAVKLKVMFLTALKNKESTNQCRNHPDFTLWLAIERLKPARPSREMQPLRLEMGMVSSPKIHKRIWGHLGQGVKLKNQLKFGFLLKISVQDSVRSEVLPL